MDIVTIVVVLFICLWMLAGVAVVAWAKIKYGLSGDGGLILSVIIWPVVLLGIAISESKSETPEYPDTE